MKMAYKSLVVAAAFAMAGVANAATESVTITTGGSVSALGADFSNLQGSGTLAFSEDLLGALAVAGIVTSEVSPATVAQTAASIEATAPVASLTATVDDVAGNFTATQVATSGGASLVTGAPNFATKGGSLVITNITVDLVGKRVLADVSGGNGLALQTGVHVWDYANITGPVTFDLANGTANANNTLTGLKITEGAFDLFAQGLGLKAGGIAAMSSIADYGVITSAITTDVAVVPEPSTYALAGVGLLIAGFAAKRRRAA